MSKDTPQSSSRRHFVGMAAAALAAGSLSRLAFADTTSAIGKITEPANGDKSAIRPFRVHVSESQLVDMRRRIKATRWPDRETVPDESQGIQLATIQGLAQYWATGYDWRKCEAPLNSYPHFLTAIDGLAIHFIHVPSQH